MNQEFKKFDPEDPRLTDYVLGELDESARMEMEWQLEHCSETRAAIDELQELSQQLQTELQTEPAAGLTDSQRTVIQQEAANGTTVAEPKKRPISRKVVVAVSAAVTVTAATLLLAVLPQSGSSDNATLRFNSLFGRLAGNETTGVEFSDEYASLSIDNDFSQQDDLSTVLSTPSQSNVHSIDEKLEQSSATRGSRVQSLNRMSYGVQLAQTENQPLPTGLYSAGKKEKPISKLLTSKLKGTSLGLSIVDSVTNNSTTTPALPDSFSVRLRKGKTTSHFGTVLVPTQQATSGKSDRLSRNKQRLAGQKGSTTYTTIRPANKKLYDTSSPAPTQRGYTVTDLRTPRILLTEEESLGRRLARNETKEFDRKLNERTDGWNLGVTVQGTEQYEPIIENEFLAPQKAPLSTFGIDVDTAAYSNMRRFLNQGQLPPANAVRIEELINYFSYSDAQPEGEHPFSVNLELGPCAWNPQHQLVRVGLKGKEIAREDRPASNLVFLIDVSGSMKSANKLPLVKTSLHMLVEQMTDNDRIAIVTYAGNAGLQLPSTSGVQKQVISSAIDRLVAGGSTNGEAGIGLAYQTAVDNLLEEGTNRVILCTDGDFNVGVSGNDDLVRIIQDKAKSGVFLSIFGFGMGNLKDAKLEALADKGNGQYGYIDNRAEARKVFVEEMTGTLHTIAKDLKIQVEFNPAYVGEYRLIGYENRVLAAEDFANDKKDAGDIGAGHSVTALYEIVPAGVTRLANTVEGLKYQKTVSVKKEQVLGDPESNELLTVKLRYKQPDGHKSTKVEFPLKKQNESPKQVSQNFQWSSAVAMFGLLLRDSQHAGAASFDGVLEMATRSQGADLSGYRSEFLDLVRKARSLKTARR